MGSILIFAGTTEGRRLAELLGKSGVDCHVSVATEYGKKVMEENSVSENVTLLTGRLDHEQIKKLLEEKPFDCVVDATHPFAVRATAEIEAACAEAGLTCFRLSRQLQETGNRENLIFVKDLEEAARVLNELEGNILSVIGSKEIVRLSGAIKDRERLYARVLPTGESIKACEDAGLTGKQIIAMQGPFSRELNKAMLMSINAACLLTKETGRAGGYPEKLEAAEDLGIKAVVIENPEKTHIGLSFEELVTALKERFGYPVTEEEVSVTEGSVTLEKRPLILAGIGPGSASLMTVEVKQAILEADILFGAPRLLESVSSFTAGRPSLAEYKSALILDHLNAHPEYRRPVVLFSGDTGYYSGALSLLRDLRARGEEELYEVRFLCGISSIVYFCSRARLSWGDVRLLSRHGRSCNVVGQLRLHQKILLLLSGLGELKETAEELIRAREAGILVDPRAVYGYQLSYPEEDIRELPLEEILQLQKDGLYILYVSHEGAKSARITPGLPDSAFIRGKAPMTKEEVRSVSLCKLRLASDSVVYDIGAGTVSVSLEASLLVREGEVYAIEYKEDAFELLGKNKEKFCASNLHPVRGKAPEALEQLPPPTHAFIGGSAGNMEEILRLLLDKNPSVRVVINCIALETIAEVTGLLKKMSLKDPEVVQLGCARANPIGSYHLLQSENPIFIVSFGG